MISHLGKLKSGQETRRFKVHPLSILSCFFDNLTPL
jgi:hypothetical protein